MGQNRIHQVGVVARTRHEPVEGSPYGVAQRADATRSAQVHPRGILGTGLRAPRILLEEVRVVIEPPVGGHLLRPAPRHRGNVAVPDEFAQSEARAQAVHETNHLRLGGGDLGGGRGRTCHDNCPVGPPACGGGADAESCTGFAAKRPELALVEQQIAEGLGDVQAVEVAPGVGRLARKPEPPGRRQQWSVVEVVPPVAAAGLRLRPSPRRGRQSVIESQRHQAATPGIRPGQHQRRQLLVRIDSRLRGRCGGRRIYADTRRQVRGGVRRRTARADRQRRAHQPAPDPGAHGEEPLPRQQPLTPTPIGLLPLQPEFHPPRGHAPRHDPDIGSVAGVTVGCAADGQRCTHQPMPNPSVQREEPLTREEAPTPAPVRLLLLQRKLHPTRGHAPRHDPHVELVTVGDANARVTRRRRTGRGRCDSPGGVSGGGVEPHPEAILGRRAQPADHKAGDRRR